MSAPDSDIVERLRSYASGLNHYSPPSPTVSRLLLRDAAGEIQALRAVVTVLHDMLPPGADTYGWREHSPADEAFRRAIGAAPESAINRGADA